MGTILVERPASSTHVRLSKREMEVLRLVGQGLTSRDAAEQLFLSKRTVDFHLANIYEKLGVSNRLQAFRAATRLGVIPFEPTSNGVMTPRANGRDRASLM